jgi:predicted O-methyltransferase YrrM
MPGLPDHAGGLRGLEDRGVIVDPALAGHARDDFEVAAEKSPTGRSGFTRIAKRGLRVAASGRVGQRLLRSLLDDPRTVSRLLHRLSNRSAARASFEADAPAALRAVEGFEDCVWLFSSNPLNHGLARLELDEASYLFRLVRSLDEPVVGEIGRFRGGTTFLLAAAGARHVLSVDFDLTRQRRYAAELADALERFGLRDRVQIVVADSRTWPLEPRSFQLVFIDGDHSYDGVRADFAHWWPALEPGGSMVFHDARFPEWDSRLTVTRGVVRFVAELEREEALERLPAPGSLAVFVKSSETLSERLLRGVQELRPAG